MSSEKRDFTDFHKFPGEINEGKGIYEFPLLKHIDDKSRMRQWQIFVRLVKTSKRQTAIDWNLLDEKQIPIKDDYFDSAEGYTDLPAGVIAEAWIETGIEGGKITRSFPTYFDKIGFEGQSNQRNPFQQALIYARAQYLKRVEKGGSLNAQGTKKSKGNIGSTMYFPMLAKKWKDGSKHLTYPLYIQPKLDGVRCLVFLRRHNGGEKNVVVYSRSQKEFPAMDHLKKLLYRYLNDMYDTEKNQSIYLDGELYKHGKKLQDISGESRNEKKRPATKKEVSDVEDEDEDVEEDESESKSVKKKVNRKSKTNSDDNNDNNDEEPADENKDEPSAGHNEYHIYDCFYPLELDTAYESRKEQLEVLFDAMKDENDTAAQEVIKPVPTILVKSEEDAVSKYESFIAVGYEGAILRNIDGVYLASATKTGTFMRSNDLVKMKNKFSDEFEVVGYTEGKKGKGKGAVIWIAKTADGMTFKATPKDITDAERYKIFKQCKKDFEKLYLGRMLTIEYEDLSKKGVPQRAKALVFRDYE
jgi:ATP-dependent DNA ligase